HLGKYKIITNTTYKKGEKIMLWTIIGLLFIFWLLGLVFHIGGGIIHILLVIAVIVLIVKLVKRI
ncbi:lmo0937 family membrane protein, partial [Priestia megaterium]